MGAHERRRRRELLFFLRRVPAVTGPFGLPLLHIAWCEARRRTPPMRFGYVPWMMGAGLVLPGAGAVW